MSVSSVLISTSRTVLAAFFCVHYGIFWFVHGAFVFTLPLFVGAFRAGGFGLHA